MRLSYLLRRPTTANGSTGTFIQRFKDFCRYGTYVNLRHMHHTCMISAKYALRVVVGADKKGERSERLKKEPPICC